MHAPCVELMSVTQLIMKGSSIRPFCCLTTPKAHVRKMPKANVILFLSAVQIVESLQGSHN